MTLSLTIQIFNRKSTENQPKILKLTEILKFHPISPFSFIYAYIN